MRSRASALPTASHSIFQFKDTPCVLPLGLLPVLLPGPPPTACTDFPAFLSPAKQTFSSRADQVQASLGFRLKRPPCAPSLWATSSTSFPEGKKSHVQQKAGPVPKALTQCPLCLWVLIDHGALVRRIKPTVYLYPWNTIDLFCGHRDFKGVNDPEENGNTELRRSAGVREAE